MGCGRAISASQEAFALSESAGIPARSVIVVRYPLPRYSPLLLGAAGLVAHGGSEAAHLVTVARALGVPAVLGCAVSPMMKSGQDTYVAIDGEAGLVSVLTTG
jgi:phosphohistidine swiveling domain-containing protein